MQKPVHKRDAPGLADHLRAENRISELARQAGLEGVAPVDREGEHVRHLVDSQMLALERTDLIRPDEVQPELAVVDPLLGQHCPS